MDTVSIAVITTVTAAKKTPDPVDLEDVGHALRADLRLAARLRCGMPGTPYGYWFNFAQPSMMCECSLNL